MPANIAQALAYLLNAIGAIISGILLLRLILPLFRADFRNPIAQGILKVTNPLVIPIRRVVPSIGSIDTATLLLAYAVQYIAVWLSLAVFGASAPIEVIAFRALTKLIVVALYLFIYSIFFRIIISWIAPGQYSPIAALVGTISEPILRPFRRIIPPLGGFDLSPILALLGLTALTLVFGGMQPPWL